MLIVFVLLLSIGANIYFFTTKDNERNDHSVVYNKAIPNEEVNTDNKPSHVDEDAQLESQFAKRREQDYKDSIAEMQRLITEKILGKKCADITQDRIRLLNQIANDVKSLDTQKGGDVNKILNKKRTKQQQIVKDFELLRKDYSQSDANRKKYNDISVRLSGSVIIATQKDGASTRAAKKEIVDVANQINALK